MTKKSIDLFVSTFHRKRVLKKAAELGITPDELDQRTRKIIQEIRSREFEDNKELWDQLEKLSWDEDAIGWRDEDMEDRFDIIGDVHGCFDELCELLGKLGYYINNDFAFLGKQRGYDVDHDKSRKLIFVGDLTDRGPKSPQVLRIVMDICKSDRGYCVLGNHDDKLKRKLMGKNVTVANGLQKTLEQLEMKEEDYIHETFKTEIIDFIDSLPSHLMLDNGKLAVTHGALKEKYFGVESERVKQYCIYGAPLPHAKLHGEIARCEVSRKPIHEKWAEEYTGDTIIVHGHIVVPEVKWTNNTVNIDTGCVHGGKLTAFRYPEMETVSVQAKERYWG